MRRAWMLAILILGTVGCGEEDAPLGGVGAACNTVNDCAAEPVPLFCVQVGSGATFTQMCTITCSSDADCAMLGSGIACVDRENKCMYTCIGGSRCPNGGECVNEACLP